MVGIQFVELASHQTPLDWEGLDQAMHQVIKETDSNRDAVGCIPCSREAEPTHSVGNDSQ